MLWRRGVPTGSAHKHFNYGKRNAAIFNEKAWGLMQEYTEHADTLALKGRNEKQPALSTVCKHHTE